VGGGSNASGIFAGFLDDKVELVGVEAGGLGLDTHQHAARIAGHDACAGVAQGYRTYFIQDAEGQMRETHSISAGLDYIGVGPILAWLHDSGRIRFAAATDQEVIQAFKTLVRQEGIIPALESSHAIAQVLKEAPAMPRGTTVLINLSGRGDKDIFTIAEALADERWLEFLRRKVAAAG
jgi:tryptophan synthase beta chain